MDWHLFSEGLTKDVAEFGADTPGVSRHVRSTLLVLRGLESAEVSLGMGDRPVRPQSA